MMPNQSGEELVAIIAEMREACSANVTLNADGTKTGSHLAVGIHYVRKWADRLAVLSSHLQSEEKKEDTDTRVGERTDSPLPVTTAGTNEVTPPTLTPTQVTNLVRDAAFVLIRTVVGFNERTQLSFCTICQSRSRRLHRNGCPVRELHDALDIQAMEPVAAVSEAIAEAQRLLDALPDQGQQWYVEAERPGHEDEARVYGTGSWGVAKPTTPRPDMRRPIANFIAAAPRLIRAFLPSAAVLETSPMHLSQENFDNLHLRCSTYAADVAMFKELARERAVTIGNLEAKLAAVLETRDQQDEEKNDDQARGRTPADA